MKKILVIGGGASGMMAAICAARGGSHVTIYEKNDRVGKKILATGNGKCNLTNLTMGSEYYYTNDKDKLTYALQSFSEKDTLSFFENLGLMLRDRDGYVYPYCEQATAVLDVLRAALEKENITIHTLVDNISIKADKNAHFQISSSIGKASFDAVILACGSKAGIKKMVTDGYDLAKAFGHRIYKLYPALVQVRCKESFFPSIAGVRCKASICLKADHNIVASEQGEVQFTDYGISGIPVFQISRLIAGYLDEKKKITVSIDFLPHLSQKEWMDFYMDRISASKGKTVENFLLGILHKKISFMLIREYGLKVSDIVSLKTEKSIEALCRAMKEFVVTPENVNPFEQAQVCRGGVAFEELTANMESIYQKNLYICGEMADVDGKCGGYNLQWAWTSGYLAGTHAGNSHK